MSLGREQRLPKGSDFDEAYSKGIVIHGSLLVVRARRSARNGTRWGFAVGKRLEKRAVRRNRVRRRMKAAVAALTAPEGWDVVVTARNPAMNAGVGQIQAAISRALQKLPREEGALP